MLEFAYPWAFALLLAPPLVWLISPVHREPARAIRFPFFRLMAEILGENPDEGSVVRRRIPLQWLFAGIAWILIVAAVARPEWIGDPIERVQTSRDVMLAIDLSGSMDEHDFRTVEGGTIQRLAAVKRVVGDFISAREGDRVGLIVFGTRAFIQAPFSQDLSTVRGLLEATEVGMAGPNTALGDAIGVAIRGFEASAVEKRLLVLLTDGSDTGSRMTPRNAAEVARQRGVVIHTIGVGDEGGTSDDRVDFETLRAIAEIGGGHFFEAGDEAGLASVYEEIDRLSPREVKIEAYRPRFSLVHWPAAAAALVVIGFYGSMALFDSARKRT